MDLSGFDKPGFSGNNNPAPARTAPAKSPYAKGLGGFLEKMLPGIGAVVGGVGGTLLAPGAGTAAGGAGGAVLGQKLEDLLTHQHTGAKTYLGQAALGTLGGVGKAASATAGAGKALLGGEGAGTAANILRLGSKGASTVASEGTPGVLNQSLVASEANAGRSIPTKLSQGAEKAGQQAMISQAGAVSKGTAGAAARDIADIRKLGYTDFNKIAEHAPIITGSNGVGTIARNKLLNAPNLGGIETSGFMDRVREILGRYSNVNDSTEGKILSNVQKVADKHNFEGGDVAQYGKIGVSHPKQLDAAIRDLQKSQYTEKVGSDTFNAKRDIVNLLKNPLDTALGPNAIGDNVKQEMISALKTQGVDNPRLIKAIQGSNSYRDISQLESKFITGKNVAQEGLESSLRKGVVGIGTSAKPTITNIVNQAAGSVAEKGISKGGNVISRLVGKPSNVAESIPQLAAQQAKKSGFMQGLVRAPGALATATPASTDQSQPQDQTQNQDASPPDQSQTDTQSGSPFNSDTIQQAILMDIATTGGKNISALTGLYNTFASPTALKNQKDTLSTADQTRHDNLNSALSSLDSAEQTLVNAGGAKGAAVGQLAKIPLFGQYLNNSGVAYEKTKTDTASQLAKAVTGGSRVNQSVYQGFLNSLPDVTDTPAQAAAKLKNLRTQMSTQAQRFGFSDLVNNQ